MTADRIVIRELQVPTLIGVYAFEREALQTLRLDVTLTTDIRRAGASDDVAHTLDYAAVAAAIQTFGAAADFQLLEAFAERLCEHLFSQFGTDRIDLIVHKDGCIPDAVGAELHISRFRSGANASAE
ncbi:MAG: dihydroneopterin aldolase [Natronospirillum sp.]